MARPANTDSEQTRRRVLGAARKLFSARGEDGASVREIAAAAKVTGATVLHHFGSKEKLYDAAIGAMYEELASMQESIGPALMSTRNFDSALESAVRALFRFAREHQPAIRLLLRHVVDTGEIGGRRREERLLPFLEMGAALFAERTKRDAGELRLVLQSIVFLVGRWAITSPREAAAVAGRRDAFAAIEDHLVDTARRLMKR